MTDANKKPFKEVARNILIVASTFIIIGLFMYFEMK